MGPYEAAVILVLNGALGLTRELALSYGILVHVMLWLPVTVWGVIEWSRLHLSLKQVEAAEYASEPEPVADSKEIFAPSRTSAGATIDS